MSKDFKRRKQRGEEARSPDPPIVLIKWYSFPKNQRFMFGQRVTDHAVDILELLVEATYSSRKAHLLADANRKIETLRWLLRLASDKNLFSGKQYEFSCHGLTECGRMVGGWWKQSVSREGTGDATP